MYSRCSHLSLRFSSTAGTALLFSDFLLESLNDNFWNIPRPSGRLFFLCLTARFSIIRKSNMVVFLDGSTLMLMPTVGKALFALKMLRVIDNFIRENLRLVVCITILSDWLSGIDPNIFSSSPSNVGILPIARSGLGE